MLNLNFTLKKVKEYKLLRLPLSFSQKVQILPKRYKLFRLPLGSSKKGTNSSKKVQTPQITFGYRNELSEFHQIPLFFLPSSFLPLKLRCYEVCVLSF